MNQSKVHQWQAVTVFFGSSFILHFLWEMLQAPLYEKFVITFWQHFKDCLFAAITGDLLFMIIIYSILALVHRNIWWVANKASYSHVATWILPVFIGLLLAANFELWAVYIAHRWTYGAMPIVPIVKIGLTPLLQMVVIPALSILFSSHFSS